VQRSPAATSRRLLSFRRRRRPLSSSDHHHQRRREGGARRRREGGARCRREGGAHRRREGGARRRREGAAVPAFPDLDVLQYCAAVSPLSPGERPLRDPLALDLLLCILQLPYYYALRNCRRGYC
jgi:hypothetical protein